jgi:crotonobetainyl-CoA:carnitine CoA-transferase CaiB-like acyl-CoA transferase
VDAPLDGYRVLSLAEQYPGPMATMVLADLGADVVMVERPAGGDPTRRFSGHFEALNRNKRSVALNLKLDEGREVFLTLLESADVLIEGFRPGVMDRLGLAVPRLRERFPSLVCASVSSYGQTGPFREHGSHDLTTQAAAGFVTTSDGGRPAPVSLPLADISSAMFATIGIVASLLARTGSSHGAYVDVSMLDCLVSWRSTTLVSALNDLDPAPYPPEDPGYGVFAAADGSLVALSVAGEDHQWRELCDELGLTEFREVAEVDRNARHAELDAELSSAIAKVDGPGFVTRCSARGVGAGLVADLPEIALNPQVVARGQIVRAGGPDGPQVVRQPLLFDGSGTDINRPAPALGEHTREVLREAGLRDGDVDQLLASGVVAETLSRINRED